MAGKNSVVYGIFGSREMAEAGVDQLIAADFRKEDISVLMQDNAGTKDFAHEKATKAPEGATTGAVTGGVVGGTLGLLAGIGALAIPGIGPFIAAGPIMGALAGVGSGGVVGGIIGALVGMGIPEYEAKRYEGRIKAGGILLSVHCDDGKWVSKAKEVLKHSGAEDVSSTGEASADYAKTDEPMGRRSAVTNKTLGLTADAAEPVRTTTVDETASRSTVANKTLGLTTDADEPVRTTTEDEPLTVGKTRVTKA